MSSTAAPLTLRRSLALVWRSLRSMRTALILLLLLALAAIAGSLVPQQGTSPATVAAMFRDHPLKANIYNAVGLFDVFGSWWFTLIYVLLLVSLGACLLPRTRAFVRNARTPPQPARELDTLRHHAELVVALAPDESIDRSERLLRRKLFRVRRVDGALAAEKGVAREGGSLVFHWAFFLVLLGVIIGKGTGFTGYAVITEGQCWSDAAVNYDGNLQEGRFASIDDHTGLQVCVKDFEDTYHRSGLPMDFVTTAEFRSPDGESLGRREIRVNHPASVDGISLYQNSFGWAPVVQVHEGGSLIASEPLKFEKDATPKGVSELALPWHGALRLPTTEPQTGLQFVLWPDAAALANAISGQGPPMMMTTADHPVLLVSAYRGDLASELRPQSAQLDKRGLARWGGPQVLREGGTVDLTSGKELEPGQESGSHDLTVTFSGLRQYTVLQVSRDRGVRILAIAAVLILLGLLASLYTSRRRVWVRARPGQDGGSVLEVGGYALQRQTQFEEEFARLARRLQTGSGGPASPVSTEPERVGSR